MSPLSLGSLIGAIIFTAAKLSLAIVEVAAHRPITSTQFGGCVTIGAIVTWSGFLAAYCRDTGIAKVTGHSSGLATGLSAYVQTVSEETYSRLSTEAHLAARAKPADDRSYGSPTPPPRRPHLVN